MEKIEIWAEKKPQEKEAVKTEYTEILKLKDMLIKEDIPFKFDQVFGGFQIRIKCNYITKSEKGRYSMRGGWTDAVEHDLSKGHKENTLELQGANTEEEFKEHDANDLMYNCVGYLTAEEVFKRWKYCLKYNTKFYLGVSYKQEYIQQIERAEQAAINREKQKDKKETRIFKLKEKIKKLKKLLMQEELEND